MVLTDNKKIEELLTRGVENIYPGRSFLEKKLKSGQRLSLYLGIDPTGSTLHLGHAIPLMKLREFQELGHQVILLIGSFTGMIGDPTDKASTRQPLTRKQVMNNCRKYKAQASNFLRFSGPNLAKIKYNHQWWDKMKVKDFINLTSNFTVQQLLARDLFAQRLEQNRPVSLHEFLYPLLQAYDSVALDVDGEIGGNDQMFNMMAGRDLMKAVINKEKFVLTTKLLEDPTGKKMGKTEGNIIALDDIADEMFGKVMSWPDQMIIPGFKIATRISLDEINNFEQEMNNGANPKDFKVKLAMEITATYHGVPAALEAEERFNKIFKEKQAPADLPEIKLENARQNILELLLKSKLVASKGEARRLIQQRGIKIDQQPVETTEDIIIQDGQVLQSGKRKFVKLRCIKDK